METGTVRIFKAAKTVAAYIYFKDIYLKKEARPAVAL